MKNVKIVEIVENVEGVLPPARAQYGVHSYPNTP